MSLPKLFFLFTASLLGLIVLIALFKGNNNDNIAVKTDKPIQITLEEEKIQDWFHEKYDWGCYQKALKEFNENHTWWRRTWGFKEEDRLWLIKRTHEILKKLLEERTSDNTIRRNNNGIKRTN